MHKNILRYDTRKNGNSWLLGEDGELVELGKFATLPYAVGEARKRGIRVDGWAPAYMGDNYTSLSVSGIRTPFDEVPVAS